MYYTETSIDSLDFFSLKSAEIRINYYINGVLIINQSINFRIMKNLFGISLGMLYAVSTNACGIHEQLVGNYCQCKLGYIRHSGQCARCPSDSKYNCRLKTCRCSSDFVFDRESHSCKRACGENQVFDGYDCVCKAGTVQIQQRCAKCPQNSYYDRFGQDCLCNWNYVWNEGYCFHKSDSRAQDKSIPKNINYYGFSQLNQQDEEDDQFTQGYLHEDYAHDKYGHHIVPQSGSSNHLTGEGDGQFQSGYLIRDQDQEQFERGYIIHDQVQGFDHTCDSNQVPVPGKGCDCKVGFARLDGYNCISCPQKGYWNDQKHACECNWGLRLEHTHYGYECVPDCGVNEISTSNGGCDCKPGFAKYSGQKCVKECSSGSWWNPVQAKCN